MILVSVREKKLFPSNLRSRLRK